MNINLLNLFVEYVEKQEILSRLTEDETLHGYSYSEIHTIAAIGKIKSPNVTGIAEYMHVTRGAISKITKKLQKENLIETYMLRDNKQKKFFRLTDKGQFLYDEHEKRHNLWLERDNDFIQKYSKEQLFLMEGFMREFNNYLNNKIAELGGKEHEN